jgi:hypothetical protein
VCLEETLRCVPCSGVFIVWSIGVYIENVCSHGDPFVTNMVLKSMLPLLRSSLNWGHCWKVFPVSLSLLEYEWWLTEWLTSDFTLAVRSPENSSPDCHPKTLTDWLTLLLTDSKIRISEKRRRYSDRRRNKTGDCLLSELIEDMQEDAKLGNE